LCDNKGNTLTIVKATTGYVFGGYTSIPWRSVQSKKKNKVDDTAFLFSLTNPTNLPAKIKIKAPGTNAVYHHPSFGPTFGSGNDLYIANTSNTNIHSYVNPTSYDFPKEVHDPSVARFIHGYTNPKFQTVEVEVFQVI
jgi:hypothetical protein